MIFKLSNVRFEESRRVVDEKLLIEKITAASTSNPYIPTTQITASSSYSVTLPNAEPGTIKVMTFTTSSETNVTINYKSGFSGNQTTSTFGYDGELIIFYASVNGWHIRTFLD